MRLHTAYFHDRYVVKKINKKKNDFFYNEMSTLNKLFFEETSS